ncbi:MAG: hypothetical protein WCJ74_00180 [bacterium]
MKHRIILLVFVVISGLVLWFADFFKDPNVIRVCVGVDDQCVSDWFYGVWLPVYKSLPYLISSIAILIFFPYNFLKIWMKIMIPYFVLALLLVATTSALCGGMICFDRTLIATGLSKIFLILTILILLIKSIYLFVISKRKQK